MGGRITESGRLGAFITKVKKGSLADVVGHLRAGRHLTSDIFGRFSQEREFKSGLKPRLLDKINILRKARTENVHLLPGDEVLQWNGKLLPGATMKEVYDIILESQAEPQVELVVSRPIG